MESVSKGRSFWSSGLMAFLCSVLAGAAQGWAAPPSPSSKLVEVPSIFKAAVGGAINCSGVPTWQNNGTLYQAGTLVIDPANNSEYRALVTCWGYNGEPSTTPSIWTLVGACGTGNSPTNTPTATHAPMSSLTPTGTFTRTWTPTRSPTLAVQSPTATARFTATATSTSTHTPAPTKSPTATHSHASPTATYTPTLRGGKTSTPTFTRTATSTPTAATTCGPTYPTSYSLNVTLMGQQESEWCWAASSSMEMSYFGVNVTQCSQATAEYGTNCCVANQCDYYSAGATCNPYSGGVVDIYNYGFSTLGSCTGGYPNTGTTLTFQQIQDQIYCQKKPFIFAWNWQGGGGHVLVAVGYNTDPVEGQMVLVNDPLPDCQGAARWMTYGDFVGETNGVYYGSDPDGGFHSHQCDLYDTTHL